MEPQIFALKLPYLPAEGGWSPYATNGGSVSCSLGVTGAGGRSGATDGGWQVYATWPEVFVYATYRAPAWFLLWEYKPGHKGRSVVIDRF